MIEVSYEKPLWQVYANVTFSCIAYSADLRLLELAASQHNRITNLPSWAIDFGRLQSDLREEQADWSESTQARYNIDFSSMSWRAYVREVVKFLPQSVPMNS